MPTADRNIEGFEQLTKQLSRMGAAVGGKVLRASARFAMLAARNEARASAPVGTPPYVYSGPAYGGTRSYDPYPRPTKYSKGVAVVAPGFTSRSVALKTWLSPDKSQANIMLGVRPGAWQAVQFVELGTSRQPARPWLEPAFRRSLGVVDSRFRKRLRQNIDKSLRFR